MNKLKENILNSLKKIKGSGRFISAGSIDFVFPGLQVENMGEISYPINKQQAEALIRIAHKAPFGKGNKTIHDNQVRSTWEIDASKLTFTGKQWTNVLDEIISRIEPDLGLEGHTISAHLYKMLIYEEGDFFLTHKDSEKEKDMFGTLIIGLPARHTGGELVVNFEGMEEVVSFATGSGDYKINYASFYADCDHELKPLTSGYRVCLVYNLTQQKKGNKIQPTSIEVPVSELTELFSQQKNNTRPHIVLLGHQYTPENFSIDNLKLNDRPKADALLKAAKNAGYYAKLCLVTSYLSGSPKYSGYYGTGKDEDAAMDEVYDESLAIEHWVQNDIPVLSNVSFEEKDLIASFALNDGKPIEKQATGYMGNYGPDLMHWYHYGAVMIWSPAANAQLLLQQNATSLLEWVDYFNKNIQQADSGEVAAVETALSTGLKNTHTDKDANYNAIADWIINKKDESFFFNLNERTCQLYFTRIDASHWLKLIEFFRENIALKIFSLVAQTINLSVLEQFHKILRELLYAGKFDALAIQEIEKLPGYFSTLNSADKHFAINKSILQDLLWIENKKPRNETWLNAITQTLTENPDREYVHKTLVPILIALKEKTKLSDKLQAGIKKYLQQQVSIQPQPPSNWTRQIPDTEHDKKQWQILEAFLASPHEHVFDYRRNQIERNNLESAIKRAEVDLKTETIKTGSPHILRIIKTQAAYNKKMKVWEEDLALLNKIMLKEEK